MKIQVVKTRNYASIVSVCYASDRELSDKYHVLAPASINECVADTVTLFNQAEKTGFIMYSLWNNQDLIGYFGKEIIHGNQMLCGFFIMPSYRTKECKNRFFKIAKSKFAGEIQSLLYTKNTRGIKFLTKNGFRVAGSFETKRGDALILSWR